MYVAEFHPARALDERAILHAVPLIGDKAVGIVRPGKMRIRPIGNRQIFRHRINSCNVLP